MKQYRKCVNVQKCVNLVTVELFLMTKLGAGFLFSFLLLFVFWLCVDNFAWKSLCLLPIGTRLGWKQVGCYILSWFWIHKFFCLVVLGLAWFDFLLTFCLGCGSLFACWVDKFSCHQACTLQNTVMVVQSLACILFVCLLLVVVVFLLLFFVVEVLVPLLWNG